MTMRVFLRIKKTSQLKKLMETYCDRQFVDINAIAFLFDGRRLRLEQTPDEVLSFLPLLVFCLLYDPRETSNFFSFIA